MPEMDTNRDIAHDHGIAIIEDAAEAIGSEYHGKRSGSFGDTGVFSFHRSKTMTTGEGGMLVTDRKDLYERCLALRDHGRAPGEKMFWNAEVGTNQDEQHAGGSWPCRWNALMNLSKRSGRSFHGPGRTFSRLRESR